MSKLNKEDYMDLTCDSCTRMVEKVDITRVLAKFDEYLETNNTKDAIKHLEYWKLEAKATNDLSSLISIDNELIGIYRKSNLKEYCLSAINELITIINEHDELPRVTIGTSYENIATGYKHFSLNDLAYGYYKKCEDIYISTLKKTDYRMISLFNNFGICLCDLKKYDEALCYYEKALKYLNHKENPLEVVMTYLNIATLYEKKDGLLEATDKISELLDKGIKILDDNYEKNGYYAFVCDKCSSVYDYYGYFLYAQELRKRVEDIYGRA